MLCFTIALRSKLSTDRWETVRKDFDATLCSIFNQTCDDFQVYVGCNEIPELMHKFDDRLHFVCVNTPKPQDWLEGCRDRAWKQLACCAAIRQDYPDASMNGSVFVFPVDADDYISNRIADYVKRHPDANGFKSSRSYRWNKGGKWLEISPYFGGTMNIIRLLPQELPEKMPDIAFCFDKDTCVKLNEKYPVRWDDIEVERIMAQQGRPLAQLPFCSTIYSLNTGTNISSLEPKSLKTDDKRIHLGVILRKFSFWKYQYLSKSIRHEFGM